MSEIPILTFFLGVALILAPIMTNEFFLGRSGIYSSCHKISLFILLVGALLKLGFLSLVWPLFCAFGFLLYLKREGRSIFSRNGLVSGLPFLFSLISSTWLVAGSNDLHLLGYDRNWSFYAALHGSVLGWIFVGCLAFLARRSARTTIYLVSSYVCLISFLFVAFGIDGVPHVKRIGVIVLTIFVPFSIGAFTYSLRGQNKQALQASAISFGSVVVSMTIAALNEFWPTFPKVLSGLPVMTVTHGFLNAIITVPCFYLAVHLQAESERNTNGKARKAKLPSVS